MGAGVAGAVLQAGGAGTLPSTPPISGPIWTIVVPAALLLVSIWGTWLLYRHFSREK